VFLLTSILDGCDGEIARAKKNDFQNRRMAGSLGGQRRPRGCFSYGLGVGFLKTTTPFPVYIHAGQWPSWARSFPSGLGELTKRGEKARENSHVDDVVPQRIPAIRRFGNHFFGARFPHRTRPE